MGLTVSGDAGAVAQLSRTCSRLLREADRYLRRVTDLPPPGAEPGQAGGAAPPRGGGAPPPAPPPGQPQAPPAYGPQAYLPQGAPVGWGPPPPRVQALGGLRTALVLLLAGS